MAGSSNWEALEAKCRARGLSQAAIDAFKSNYAQLEAGATGLVRTQDGGGGAQSAPERGSGSFRALARAPLAAVQWLALASHCTVQSAVAEGGACCSLSPAYERTHT